MLLHRLAEASGSVAASRSRLTKIERLASALRGATPEEVAVAVSYLSGDLPQGAIGVGWASLRDLPPPNAGPASLEVIEVDRALRVIAATTGPGSQAARKAVLADLFARATDLERRFLTALLLGELRQGALEGIMVEAVARLGAVPSSEVRRAVMVSGRLGPVAAAALGEGPAGLRRFRLRVLQPLQPMLAQSAATLQEALGRISPAVLEWKFDGARIQVHRLDGEVRAFTRNLADITGRVPEVVRAVGALPGRALVLDGEAIALRPDGRPHTFQVTMSRFGTRLDVPGSRREVPLTPFFFDCLHVDGVDLIDRPASERFAALARLAPPDLLVPRMVTNDPAQAERFLQDALAGGQEGLMVKAPEAPYEAGRRGAAWLKVKPARTLDLVVLAAEWGHGRRQGWLSNLHLGARDPAGGFVMLGKTFKGMTDAMLAWQTERLLRLETGRDAHTVHVRPELVVEVAFDGLQASTRYPGGVALRFARIKGYRTDKSPAEADTIDAVLESGRYASGG